MALRSWSPIAGAFAVALACSNDYDGLSFTGGQGGADAAAGSGGTSGAGGSGAGGAGGSSGGPGGASGSGGMDGGAGVSGGGSGGASAGSGGMGASGGGGGSGAGAGGAAGSAGASGSAGTGGGAGTSGSAGTGGGAGTGGDAGITCPPGPVPGCVIDFAGQFNSPGNANGVGTAARFQALGDITGDGTYLYVAANNAVRRIEIATATVTTLAGQSGSPGYVDATGAAARFRTVTGIATDGTTVWVTDTGNAVIRSIDIATGDVKTLAGSQGNPGFANGIGTAARFDEPRGLEYDGARALYLADNNNHAVRRINLMTAAVSLVAGNNGAGAMNGPGDAAQFSSPRGVGSGGGFLFVGDTENHQPRQIDLGLGGPGSNTVSAPLGAGPGYTDGTGNAALFRRLRGIDNDGSGLIVADSDNFVIRHVALPAYVVTTLAGNGTAGHVEGVGSAARFNKPMDVHFDPTTRDIFIIEDTVVRRMFYQ